MSYKCECCDNILESKVPEQGWDWFTGWLDKTVHFCPNHINSNFKSYLFNLSDIKPERYDETPKEYQSMALHNVGMCAEKFKQWEK